MRMAGFVANERASWFWSDDKITVSMLALQR
jgi:hypothetical protein